MDEYYQSEEFLQLLARYEESLKNHVPTYFEAMELGDIIQYYSSSGLNDKAMVAADLALEMHPGALEALAYKARYAMTVEGNVEKAEWYANMIEDKSDCEYYYLMAEILIQKDEIEHMEDYLKHHFDELDEDEQDDFALDVADMLNDYRLTELVLSWLHLVKDKQNPDYKSIKAKALVYSDVHDFSGEGEDLLEELTNDDPYNVEHWLSLADAQRVKEEFSECINSCDYAIAIDPQNQRAIFTKGQALLALERYDEAVTLFERHHEVCGSDGKAATSMALAFCLKSMGRETEAKTWLDRAMDESPDRESLFSVVYLSVVEGMQSEANYDLLKQFFHSLGEHNNNFWSHMALLSLELHHLDDYQYYLNQAIKRNPKEADFMLGGLFPVGSKMQDWPSLPPKEPTNGQL